MADVSSNECPLCCEIFNKSTRKEVKCATCQFSSCKSCARRYLLETTNDPHCMKCKKAWDQTFMITQLNRSYYLNEYREHRRTLLLERELSKMPETMQDAENFKLKEKIQARNQEIHQRERILAQQIEELKEQRRAGEHTIGQIEHGHFKPEKKKKFTMACPQEGCRGFLSTAYKCEICNLYTCSSCHEIVGEKRDNPDHVCDPNSVESATLIKKETKPCPSCHTRIFKIDGCDQMWCTECHAAFSWTRGTIETGVVHNPHFYNWQREQGDAPRNPGDVPCGGLPDWWILDRKLRTIPPVVFLSQFTASAAATAAAAAIELGQLRHERNLRCRSRILNSATAADGATDSADSAAAPADVDDMPPLERGPEPGMPTLSVEPRDTSIAASCAGRTKQSSGSSEILEEILRECNIKLRNGVMTKMGIVSIFRTFQRRYIVKVASVHQTLAHITYVELARAQGRVTTHSNHTIQRVLYLNKRISKEKLAAEVYRSDNLRRKYNELVHVYQLLSNVGIDAFRHIKRLMSTNRSSEHNLTDRATSWQAVLAAAKRECVRIGDTKQLELLEGEGSKSEISRNWKLENLLNAVTAKLGELDQLREYCNTQLQRIGISYNQSVIQISPKWEIRSEKFSLSALTTD